ncbi:MAG: hypothetical protein JNK87_15570 [Bryobacterales bacterium]|nr:hypothetical protein [Bryobacterales bacterium]
MDEIVPLIGKLHGTATVNTKGGEEGEKQSVENVVNLLPSHGLRIHHIDVGQGEATLIEFRTNSKTQYTVLIDGGRYTRGGGTIVRYLRKLQITTINIMICTHHDADHVEGLVRVLEDFTHSKENKITVEAVIDRNPNLLSESILGAEGYEIPAYKEEEEANGERFGETEIPKEEAEKEGEGEGKTEVIEEKLETNVLGKVEEETVDDDEAVRKVLLKFQSLAKGKNTVALKAGMVLVESDTVPKFSMTCLHCNADGTDSKQENNYSIAFLVQFGEFRYYTGGDLESHHEDKFASKLTGGKHLCSFKCGHHGSKNSTSAAFLTTTQASHAVISCGRHSYYHPDSELVGRLCAAEKLQWFDLTNCYYNRPGVNPAYLTTEIVLLKKMVGELSGYVVTAADKVQEWLEMVQAREDFVKAKFYTPAEAAVLDLQVKVLQVQTDLDGASILVLALVDENDGGCDAAFDEVEKVKNAAAKCNTLVGASAKLSTSMPGIQPGLMEVDEWNRAFEQMKATVRRFNSVAKACWQVIERFKAVKAAPNAVKGYVGGAVGYLGTVVLDISSFQAELEDHQFSVGMYQGGWQWRIVRCLTTEENKPWPIFVPTDDLSGAVSIKQLKDTNPGSPVHAWWETTNAMDPILDFSVATGASGASKQKKEEEPPSELELIEFQKQQAFQLEAEQRRNQQKRNRDQISAVRCAVCDDDSMRGLVTFNCYNMDCQTAFGVHRRCFKSPILANFRCGNCGHVHNKLDL